MLSGGCPNLERQISNRDVLDPKNNLKSVVDEIIMATLSTVGSKVKFGRGHQGYSTVLSGISHNVSPAGHRLSSEIGIRTQFHVRDDT